MADIIQIGKRIETARTDLNLTQEELAVKLGLNKSTIQRYEAGKIQKIKLPVLESMARILKVSPDWLSDKTEEREPTEEEVTLDNLMLKYDNIRPVRLRKFPLLGEIACGKPIFALEDRENYIMADMDINADFCLTAKGDSMINARIQDGDIV
ncbi:MAG: helix-turn-helix domain-containing protein, partial [Oscillospiraceae bacterium]|nr:helix-turn-helix domain-containing protein [Oscillospiraceae bacterium]